MQNKPKGKPPKTAMGSRASSSQRQLAESNSNSDSEAEFDANADAKARNLPKAARQSSTQRGKGSKKADHNFDDGKATYQFYYLITA